MSKHSPAPAIGPSQLVLYGLAEVLYDLSDEVECLGADLCADPQVAGLYLERLQGLDRLAQTARNLGDILGSNDIEEAIADVRLDALRKRLHAKQDWHTRIES